MRMLPVTAPGALGPLTGQQDSFQESMNAHGKRDANVSHSGAIIFCPALSCLLRNTHADAHVADLCRRRQLVSCRARCCQFSRGQRGRWRELAAGVGGGVAG